MDIYKDTGEQNCYYCKGAGTRTVWQGSMHDPQDPITINCKHCRGKGRVHVITDEEAH